MLPAAFAHPLDGGALYVEEPSSRGRASAAELAVGSTALAAVRDRFGADQLYARVDLLPGPDGPVLVELELTEPSLFLQHGARRGPALRRGDRGPRMTATTAGHASAPMAEERVRALRRMKLIAGGLLLARRGHLRAVPRGRRRQRRLGLRAGRRRGVDGRRAGRLVRGHRAVPAPAAAADPAHRDHPGEEGPDRRRRWPASSSSTSSPPRSSATGSPRREVPRRVGEWLADAGARAPAGRGAQQRDQRHGDRAARRRAAQLAGHVRRQAAARDRRRPAAGAGDRRGPRRRAAPGRR